MASTRSQILTMTDAADGRVSDNAAGSTFHEVDDRDRAIPAIEFRDVDLAFDDRQVLNRLSFRVMKGETKIILGGSGGGKSTIIKLVLGLLKPDAGQVLVDVSSIFVTHEMNNLDYICSEYAVVNEAGEVVFEREGERLCLINSKVLMVREGNIIFSGTDETLRKAGDPYIQRFLRGH